MTALSAFHNKKFRPRQVHLKVSSASDFGGGLNLIDNDLTMKSRYAKVLTNWVQGTDGSLSVRWGTKLKYDITSVVTGTLIELVYFKSHLLAFTTTGQIAKIDSAGTITAIWSTAIAALLPAAPAGWSSGLAVGSIDTSEFKGELVVCNGIDKPILISSLIAVTYLQDLATGSNVNVPIGKYVTTVGNYLIISGITSLPNTIYISSGGTSGVWPGDAAPNDSISKVVGSFIAENSGTIIGLGSFRNQLLVMFEGSIVVLTLGIYDDSATPVHTPEVQDSIVEHGILNFRTTVTTKNDFVMADISGWHTAKKNSFGLVTTESMSELVDPAYQASIDITPAQRTQSFSVWNKLEQRVTTFVSNGDGTFTGWTMSYRNEKVQQPSWSKHTGWSFTCGCNTERGRIFLGLGTKIYQYGNAVFADEEYNGDLMGVYTATWATVTAYTVGQQLLHSGNVYIVVSDHVSTDFDQDFADGKIEDYEGVPISFDWELPWSDLRSRTQKKRSRFFQADTEGEASFTVQLFVDNFYLDVNGDYDPAVEMAFEAGTSPGYGDGDQPYGGGRRLRDERPWELPADFKIVKLRISGATTKALKIITISLLYMLGSFRR